MKRYSFIYNNKWIIFCMLIGTILAYFFWLEFGVYWGTYPLSSECWVNCLYGCLMGGMVGSFLSNKKTNE